MTDFHLIIETSIHGAAVGFTANDNTPGELLYQEFTDQVVDSARQLPLMVQRGLAKLDAVVSDISGIIVGQGPGSFTGIRVGLAYSFGLLVGLNTPEAPLTEFPDKQCRVVGVSALSLIAKHCIGEDKTTHFGSDDSFILYLPSTKSAGYGAVVQDQHVELVPVDLTQPNNIKKLPRRWTMITELDLSVAQAMLAQAHSQIELVGTVSPLSAVRRALSLMATCNEFSDEFPDAIYLRKSSVEEKNHPIT